MEGRKEGRTEGRKEGRKEKINGGEKEKKGKEGKRMEKGNEYPIITYIVIFVHSKSFEIKLLAVDKKQKTVNFNCTNTNRYSIYISDFANT